MLLGGGEGWRRSSESEIYGSILLQPCEHIRVSTRTSPDTRRRRPTRRRDFGLCSTATAGRTIYPYDRKPIRDVCVRRDPSRAHNVIQALCGFWSFTLLLFTNHFRDALHSVFRLHYILAQHERVDHAARGQHVARGLFFCGLRLSMSTGDQAKLMIKIKIISFFILCHVYVRERFICHTKNALYYVKFPPEKQWPKYYR